MNFIDRDGGDGLADRPLSVDLASSYREPVRVLTETIQENSAD